MGWTVSSTCVYMLWLEMSTLPDLTSSDAWRNYNMLWLVELTIHPA